MPLSLLAKDSIQDLTSLATSREDNVEGGEADPSSSSSLPSLSLGETTTATATTTADDAAAAVVVVEGQVTETPVLGAEQEVADINNNNTDNNLVVGISSGRDEEETGHFQTEGSINNNNNNNTNQNANDTSAAAAAASQPEDGADEDETEVADNLSGPNNNDENENDPNNNNTNNNDIASTLDHDANVGVVVVEEHAANPQQAQEEEEMNDDEQQQQPSTAAYAGFRSDYYQQRYHYGTAQQQQQRQQQRQQHLHGDEHMDDSDSSYYYHDTYAPPVLLGQSSASSQPFFPKLIFCLFPWLARPEQEERLEASYESDTAASFEPQTFEQQVVAPDTSITAASATATAAATPTSAAGTKTTSDKGNNDNQKTITPPPTTRSEDDECSSGSDALGEKLSAKERQAVLARLGLARPDEESNQNNYFGNQEEQGSTSSSTRDARKGLLNGIPTYDTSPLEEDMQDDATKKLKGILKKRGSADLDMVKNTSAGTTSSNKQGRKEEDTRRRRSLFPSYKTSVKSGLKKHVRFAPMARVVTVKSKNDMLPEEKADIWWQKTDYEDFRKTGRIITRAMLEGGSEIWLAQTSSTPENAQSSDYAAESTGDKWWHKFGHSRRGLEHVVSVQEGRERQINVRTAIRAVLEEQARQKMYKREDAEKLRKVSLNFTSWARDLALAAGHSDADAVTSEFSSARKSREFYLLKFSRNQNTKNNVVLHHVPGFMQPKMHAPAAVGGGGVPSPPITKTPRITQPHLLDANTAAQISFRRRKVAPKPETPATTTTTTTPSETEESSEPIKDPKPEDHSHESLAHRAAGFSVEGEKVDMAAVLSGMGAVPQESHHHKASATPVAS